MINFTIDQSLCSRCGDCVADCPARIIAMTEEAFPMIAPDMEPLCYKCQHCLAVCPTGAVSILGLHPENSQPVAGNFPDPARMATLIKGRRSIRRYEPENLEPAMIQHLLEVAWHAPTGVNSRQVRFTVVDDRMKLARLRDEVMAGLVRLVQEDGFPEGLGFYAEFVRMWEEEQIDVIFRNAPHLLVASVPPQVVSPMPDCLIALTCFDLFAQANGIGTLWNGLAKLAINDLVPETRVLLDIPDDHLVGYAMVFGRPAVHHVRTVQHGPALIHRMA
jgi:nitroreductase/NAD-dependent dihydropyrimidine dehydrogenase PreA subunit